MEARPDRIPLLQTMPAGLRDRLEGLFRHQGLATGAVFMRESEPTTSMAIVTDGRVALRLRIPERGPATILTLEAGDIVGWSALVPPYRATATAVALEPTTLAVVGAAELRDALAADPELAAAFLPLVLAAAAARVTATRDQLLDLFRGPEGEPW